MIMIMKMIIYDKSNQNKPTTRNMSIDGHSTTRA